MMTDLEGRIMDVNNAFSTLTGYQRAEILGQSLPYPWLQEEQMATFVQWAEHSAGNEEGVRLRHALGAA